jgi:hypothetical protein
MTLPKDMKSDSETADELISIRGILIAVDWDENGNTLAAAVFDRDEEEYLVHLDAKGKELLGFIRREVGIIGVVRKTTKGRKTITVKSYVVTMNSDW